MNGNKVALDTNQAIAILNNAIDPEKIRPYDEIYLPVPVVGELRFGALSSQRQSENLERIDKLVHRCSVLVIDEQTTPVYASIRRDLKQKGRPIPGNDVWIAALCVHHSLPLATDDSHFLEISDLQMVSLM